MRVVLLGTIVFVGITYTWYTRLDERNPDRNYNYYSELARSFKRGYLYLAEEPSSALLALDNPYDYFLRKQEGVEDFPWDVSLYKNKFYIYWGPAPALCLLPFSDKTLVKIEDHHIALAFAFGLFLYAALIAAVFWRRLKNAPIWVFGISLFVLALSIPTVTMLSGANIYETAIFACQFFFIGGCYWAYSSFRDNAPSEWKLALASIHWGLAVGSRMTILPVVAFAAGVSLFGVAKRSGRNKLKQILSNLAVLGAPLLVTGVLLGWYNWARFDSVLEFGIQYQLTNVNYIEFKDSFSVRYIPGNLEHYFIHPISVKPRFPFISPVEFTASNARLAGLLYVAPFILLIFSPLPRMIMSWGRKHQAAEETNHDAENWMGLLLGGSAFIAALIILAFYFVTMRYMEDFMPSLLLLTILLVGREYQALSGVPGSRMVLSLFVIVTGIINLVAGLLIAMPAGGVAFMVNLLNSISKVLGFK
ncbi:MAG: hypothetical protein HND47_20100 [Chloroflexi bacterium]|nr:hypothetical protein [Chloroflexota bacterium]